MRLLRRLAGFLGFAREEGQEARDVEDNTDGNIAAVAAAAQAQNVPRRGFSVPIQVPVEKAQFGPILFPCSSRDGAVQGLRWYAKRLRIDEDGDVADEFFDEIRMDTPSSGEEHQRRYPKFELKYSTKPAKVTTQALSAAGIIQHCVEHHGRLEWI
ncbi:PREDICTED: uncharacterized protein LOC109240501 [Nicotiana attenuata]|uniref:Uncharacterized protein n=1 Tax=Nicotiana attenuata TaxID=49451 RepID=A0A314L771_NICAT|nr:PREDICTED: uncharacterized protein LOC109240501 [Nicotiana attenuata]OIT37631.1 hypothetical protein A4A49_07534 [Nicotiana attenuata]